MTVHAIQLVPDRAGARVHSRDEAFVTANAVTLYDSTIARGDLDRLLEVLEGERHRVPEAVVRLRDPLGQAVRGQMTLDTGGGVPVPALQPRVVLLVHDVAVHTRPRIGRQVRKAPGVHEREAAETRGNADETGEDQEEPESTQREVAFVKADRRPWLGSALQYPTARSIISPSTRSSHVVWLRMPLKYPSK